MVRTGKPRHISADFGDDHFRRAAGYARNGIQQTHGLVERATNRLDPRIKAGDRLIEAVDPAQQLRQYKPMMRFHPALQRTGYLVPFAAQAAFGQLGQGLRVRMTREQCRY